MRKRTLLLSVVGLAVLALGLWSLQSFLEASHHPTEVLLPAGKRMRLLDATFGLNHFYTLRSHWFSNIVPRWAARYLRIPPPEKLEMNSRINHPMMVLWLEFPDGSDLLADTYILTGDDGSEQLTQASHTTLFPDGIRAVGFNAFPRQANQIEVKAVLLGANGKRTASAPLFVRNKLRPGASSKWSPTALPATSADRGTKFTLIDLMALKINPVSPDEISSYYSYTVEEPGASAAEWQSKPIRITNASGDFSESFSYANSRDGVMFTNGLSPSEPWKLEVEYYKNSHFQEADLVEVRDLAVPALDTQTELNQELVSGAAKARLKAFGNRKWELGTTIHTGPFKGLVFENPADANLKVIRASDDQGREFNVNVSNYGNWLLFRFDLEPDARSINVTLAVVPKYRAEFVVQPRTVAVLPK